MSDQATDRQVIEQLNQLQAGRHLVCNVCHQEHPRTEYAPAYRMFMCPDCRWGTRATPPARETPAKEKGT